MREKIFAYLKDKDRPATAQELVREILEIQQANEAVSRRLIGSLLESDPRFQWDAQAGQVTLVDREPPEIKDLLAETLWGVAELSTVQTEPGRLELVAMAAIRARGRCAEDRLLAWTVEGRRYAARELGWSAGELDEAASNRALLSRFCQFLQDAVWVSFEPRRDLALLNGRLQAEGLIGLDPPALGLRALAKKLFPGETVRTLEEAATCLGLSWADVSQPELRARLAMEVLAGSLDLAEELQITTRTELLDFQNREAEPIDWSRYRFDGSFLTAIPKQPGVYFFTDRAGAVIYVGKAKNLNSRIQSYFQSTGTEEEKKRALRASAYDLTYEVLGSELEALLQEARAIKVWRPRINTQMEIHESESDVGQQGNRLLILPAREAAHAELFLIRSDQAVEQITIARDLSDIRAAERRVKRFFFAKRKKAPPAEELWKASLIARWLKRNRDRVLAIDPDQTADWSECARLLRRYAQEPADAEKVIHR